jgi:ubiquinone/menaquinone biosynthesis C-methylase UbiE
MHAVAPPPRDPLSEPSPWSAVAADYDEVWFERLPALTSRVIELLAPDSGDRVLDVASGPGTLAVCLAPRVGHVMAIDFAEGMIERLRGHIMRSRLPNLEARLMDAQQLSFDDASFDAAVSLFGVASFADRARGLAEMSRVVVPGGRVVLASWAAPEHNALLGAALSALNGALPESSRFTTPAETEPPELLESQLDSAGFEQVTRHELATTVEFDSADDYWHEFERTSPELVLLERELGAESYAQVTTRAREALRAGLGTGPVVLQCRVLLAYAERPLSAA